MASNSTRRHVQPARTARIVGGRRAGAGLARRARSGTHHGRAIEMTDRIVLVDTPNGEAQALAVFAKTTALIPGTPTRSVVALHHHWDHLSGIRTAIDEGATIVTHETNRAFLELAATAPHTIHPDGLGLSKTPLKIQLVATDATLTDDA